MESLSTASLHPRLVEFRLCGRCLSVTQSLSPKLNLHTSPKGGQVRFPDHKSRKQPLGPTLHVGLFVDKQIGG